VEQVERQAWVAHLSYLLFSPAFSRGVVSGELSPFNSKVEAEKDRGYSSPGQEGTLRCLPWDLGVSH